MNIDLAREHIVIVNGGSGCLLQPMTDEYTYLLTAKHNITGNQDQLPQITYFVFTNPGWEEKTLMIDNFQKGLNYFPHDQMDIAIIKLPKFVGYDNAFRFDLIDTEKGGFHLLGYPKQRRDNNKENKIEWYRRDDGVHIKDPRGNGLYEATVPGHPTLVEIKGHSGGCIGKIYKDKLYVAGIQNKMADEKEELGNVRFTPLNHFDDIVKQYPELAPIFPCHLKSFSFLQNEAFNLNAGVFVNENIKFVKNFLKNKAKEVIQSTITPKEIRNLFEERLLLFNESPHTLHSKGIWILWLEFLTILNILKKENLSEERIKEIFNQIRLICSDTDKDWSEELGNMIYSDYRGLKKNGTVIIGVSKPPADEVTYVLKKKIPLIANAIRDIKSSMDKDMLKIDDGITFPLDDFTFIHIEYFKKSAIILKNAEYVAIAEDEELILEKLKEEYKKLLTHE